MTLRTTLQGAVLVSAIASWVEKHVVSSVGFGFDSWQGKACVTGKQQSRTIGHVIKNINSTVPSRDIAVTLFSAERPSSLLRFQSSPSSCCASKQNMNRRPTQKQTYKPRRESHFERSARQNPARFLFFWGTVPPVMPTQGTSPEPDECE